MLEVFIDRGMIAPVVNAINSNRKEHLKLDDRKLAILVEDFLKQGCNLHLDDEIKLKSANVLTQFTQGMGENRKPVFVRLSAEIITRKKWSVALLDKASGLYERVANQILTIERNNFWTSIASLLFESPNQEIHYEIRPYMSKGGNGACRFKGWKSLTDGKLVPLTDAIIIDPYFLKPVGFRKDDFVDIQAYARESLLPLLELLYSYSINKQIFVNIFTERQRDNCDAAELMNYLEELVQQSAPGIKLLLIEVANLSQHKRILYSNYFAIRTELSFHHFRGDKVFSYKKDEMSVIPFARDKFGSKHQTMLGDLVELYHLSFKQDSLIYNNIENLSPMIIQAYKQSKNIDP